MLLAGRRRGVLRRAGAARVPRSFDRGKASGDEPGAAVTAARRRCLGAPASRTGIRAVRKRAQKRWPGTSLDRRLRWWPSWLHLSLACAESGERIPNSPGPATRPAIRRSEGPDRQPGAPGPERLHDGRRGRPPSWPAPIGELGKLYHGVQLLDTPRLRRALRRPEDCYREARRGTIRPTLAGPICIGLRRGERKASTGRGGRRPTARRWRSNPDLAAGDPAPRTVGSRTRPDGRGGRPVEPRAGDPEPEFAAGPLRTRRCSHSTRGDAEAAVETTWSERVAVEPGAGRGHYSLGMAWRTPGRRGPLGRAPGRERATRTSPFDDPLVRELAYLPAGQRRSRPARPDRGRGRRVRGGRISSSAAPWTPTRRTWRRARHLALARTSTPASSTRPKPPTEELLALDPAQAPAHFELAQLLANRGRARRRRSGT